MAKRGRPRKNPLPTLETHPQLFLPRDTEMVAKLCELMGITVTCAEMMQWSKGRAELFFDGLWLMRAAVKNEPAKLSAAPLPKGTNDDK